MGAVVAELSFALRTGSKISLSDLPISLADVPDGKLIAEVLRRGDRLDLAGVLASMPDDRLYRELSGRRPLRLDLSEIAEGELYGELDRRGRLPRMALSAVNSARLFSRLSCSSKLSATKPNYIAKFGNTIDLVVDEIFRSLSLVLQFFAHCHLLVNQLVVPLSLTPVVSSADEPENPTECCIKRLV